MRRSLRPDPCTWAVLSEPFLDALADRLSGKRVLEVFAGRGRLAARLAARGVAIRATSLFGPIDGHDRGLLHPVEELDALAAVRRYGPDSDALLMSWPDVTEAAAAAALEWGEARPLFWIGEITRHDLGLAGLGGCATDLFHAVAPVAEEIPGYAGRGRLDRAARLSVRPECAARWRAGERTAAIARPSGAGLPGGMPGWHPGADETEAFPSQSPCRS